MTGKEIIKKAINLEPTPRMPVMILSGGVWAYKQIGKSLQDSFDISPEESSDYWVEVNKKINSDLIWCAAGCNNLGLRSIGAPSDFSVVGVAATVESMIENPSDVDKIDLSVMENDPGIQKMLASTRLMKEKMGNDTLLAVSQWGPLTLASQMIGVNKLMKLMRKDAEAVFAIMDFTRELVVKYWSLFIEAGVEHVSIAEPLASGDMISPKMFEKYVIPYAQYVNKAVEGKVSRMLHICGNTEHVLPLIPDTGTDMFSLDFKTSLVSAREHLDGKVAFAGHIDPVNVMMTKTPAEITADAERCGREAEWQKGGFILMPGCDLAPATPLENIQAMSAYAHSQTQNI